MKRAKLFIVAIFFFVSASSIPVEEDSLSRYFSYSKITQLLVKCEKFVHKNHAGVGIALLYLYLAWYYPKIRKISY